MRLPLSPPNSSKDLLLRVAEQIQLLDAVKQAVDDFLFLVHVRTTRVDFVTKYIRRGGDAQDRFFTQDPSPNCGLTDLRVWDKRWSF